MVLLPPIIGEEKGGGSDASNGGASDGASDCGEYSEGGNGGSSFPNGFVGTVSAARCGISGGASGGGEGSEVGSGGCAVGSVGNGGNDLVLSSSNGFVQTL